MAFSVGSTHKRVNRLRMVNSPRKANKGSRGNSHKATSLNKASKGNRDSNRRVANLSKVNKANLEVSLSKANKGSRDKDSKDNLARIAMH
jgi:hypothetical protein